uniref:Ig-like domain-containing protein n=1 Tax=Pundamilia nyererei TaxID=303518 RepID=A0A3B4HBA7_9CICH
MSFSLTVHCLKVSICSHPVGFCTTSPETGQAPKFDVPLEPVTVGEGEKLSLQCHVTGSTPITIQWMKDRRELVSSGNTKISFVGGTANLEISQVSKTDAGDYLCKASNANGTDFCKCVATNKHGEIESGADMEVTKKEDMGEVGDLRTRLKKTPSKQKSPKKEEEVNIVELLRGHDPKDYERILREHGIHDYRAILQAVEFLKKEKEMETGRAVRQKVSEKKTVSFVCKVNRPGATVRWLKAGQEVTLSKRIVYRVDGLKHSLTVKDCIMEDEGEYTAVVGDDKCAAELIISEAPTDFTAQLKDQTITEFEDAEFTCKLNRVEVKWMRNNMIIVQGDKYQMISEGKVHRLQVCEIRPRDQGEYRIVAKDKDARAKLELAGESTSHLNEFMEVEQGSDISIVAQIRGCPFPTLTWYKAPPHKSDAKVEVQYDEHINKIVSDDSCTLLIQQGKRPDTGLYTLVASNSLGKASKEMRLNVREDKEDHSGSSG